MKEFPKVSVKTTGESRMGSKLTRSKACEDPRCLSFPEDSISYHAYSDPPRHGDRLTFSSVHQA